MGVQRNTRAAFGRLSFFRIRLLRRQDVDMGIDDTKRGTWFSVVVGAVIGLALGVLVSVTADVPLAIEAGLVLGALVGWLSRRLRT
jgi:hypothetical protein